MKTVLALLAALALSGLVLLGIGRLSPSDRAPGSSEPGSAVPEQSEDDLPAEEPAAPTSAPAEEEPGAPREASAAAAPEGGEEGWANADSVWLRGTVSARGPCARDEELVVYAFDHVVDLRELDRVLAAELSGDEEVEPGRQPLSRRTVGPDLAFELPLPPDAEEAHVIALGRYLYMPATERIEVGDGAAVLRPRCGAAIEGRVEVAGADPLEENELELELSARLEGQLSRRMDYGRKAAAAADGRFTIRGVLTARAFTLDADCERLAPQRTEIEPLGPGETHYARLVLTPGATVHGRVVDEAGAPVAEAEVDAALKKLLSPDLGEREATTDADGRFTLRALPPGAVTLQATRDGYRDSENELVTLTEGEEHAGVELVLDAGAAIAGTLTWGSGLPAEGVEVLAELDPAQRFRMGGLAQVRGTEGKDVTGADGRFRITGLGDSRFDLRASAEPDEEVRDHLRGALAPDALGAGELAFEEEWIAYAPSVKAGAEDLELLLELPSGVSGRVVDETGAPVTDFKIRAVQLVETQLGDFARDQREESFEDAEGRFRLKGLVDGAWNLFAIAEGYSSAGPTSLALPEEEAEPLELRVVHAASVSGTIYTPRGTPVGGATVSIDTGGPFWKSEISGAPTPPSVTSAEDGTYTLEDLPPGTVTLVASAEGHARAVAEPLELAPNQHVGEVDLTLREGGTVVGVVYGSDGELSPGRTVQAVRMSDMASHFTRTDSAGEFRLEHVDAGSWQVQALPAQELLANIGDADDDSMGDIISEIKTAVAEVEEGGTTHVELGRPPADPIELRGRVTAQGQPFPRALVGFYTEGKDMLQRLRNTRTDSEGRFTLTLDGPGNYIAAVQTFGEGFTQQSSVEFQVEVPEVEEHELELELPTGRISGHLRAAGGRPVSGERVTLYPAGPISTGSLMGGGYSEVRSQEDGAFELSGLRPGTYSVAAGGMPYGGMFDRSAKYGRGVREVEVEEGEWVQGVDFRLEDAARANVRVLDGAGKPVAGAAVFVRDEAGHLLELFSATSTDSSGVCEYGGLAPGRYSFSARKDGYASEETRPIEVGGAEMVEVPLVLEEGTILWVKLLDGEGDGVQARISVLDEDGRQVGTMVALDEIFDLLGGEGFSLTERRIGPLPPGEYQVIATTADGKEESKPVTLRKRTERRLSIYFRD